MDVQTVLEMNRARQQRAHALNLRAGGDIFLVFTKEQVSILLQQLLPGVSSLREIDDPEALLLPEIDLELASLVENENPEKISLLGREIPVTYREGMHPLVELHLLGSDRFLWKDLPDEGIRLPGGREVEVTVCIGWDDPIEPRTNIPELKAACAKYLAEKTWRLWTDRPKIPIPDYTGDAPPPDIEIIECQYGTWALDGSPLMAYGVVAVNHYYSYVYGGNPFEVKWFRDREEAERARQGARAELRNLRAQFLETEIKDMHVRVKWITDDPCFLRLEWSLRESVEGLRNLNGVQDLSQPRQILAEADAALTREWEAAERNGSSYYPAPTPPPAPAKPSKTPPVTVALDPMEALRAKFGGKQQRKKRR